MEGPSWAVRAIEVLVDTQTREALEGLGYAE